jgi:hypothetical protein
MSRLLHQHQSMKPYPQRRVQVTTGFPDIGDGTGTDMFGCTVITHILRMAAPYGIPDTGPMARMDGLGVPATGDALTSC